MPESHSLPALSNMRTRPVPPWAGRGPAEMLRGIIKLVSEVGTRATSARLTDFRWFVRREWHGRGDNTLKTPLHPLIVLSGDRD